MNPFATKSIYLPWPKQVGDPFFIASYLKGAGFESVMLHSTSVWAFPGDISPAVVTAVRGAGLQVIGSVAVYGIFPEIEGHSAGMLVQEYNLDGFSFDAESEFDKHAGAEVPLLAKYHEETGKPCSWCSWAFPSYHQPGIIHSAMRYCEAGTPMAYWNPGTSAEAAARYLRSSLAEWDKLTNKPICPAGRAYNGDNGTATPEGIAGFAAEVKAQNLPGLTWWDMYHAVKLPAIWQALAQTPGMKQPEVDESKLTNKVFMPKVNR